MDGHHGRETRYLRSLTRLKALQALEASARHGSFVGAAAEMGVTPAAVGQLVRSLEIWAGYPLFRRTRSGVRRLIPVDDVQAALEEISQGLDRLEAGLKNLRGRMERPVVVVTASQAFVAQWLLPRLGDFAVGGRGLALVRKALVMREIDAGHLHHLQAHNRWPVKWGYFAVSAPKALRRPETRAFHDWLLRQSRPAGSMAATEARQHASERMA